MKSLASITPFARRRIVVLIYGGLLVFAAIYWGASARIGAPFVYHPDEPDVVGRAVKMLVTGDLNPHWFHYPTLPMYLYAAAFKFLNLFVDIPMELGFLDECQGARPQVFILYYTARIITICFSLGTLCLLLRLASRMTSPIMASLAGIIFIGSEIVRGSATAATVDMPMTFFAFASLVLMLKFADSARRGDAEERWLWFAAVMGGLAAGFKYNGGAVLLVAPLAMRLAGKPLGWSLRRLPLLALLSIAVFTVTTPWIILDAKAFFSTRGGMLFHFVHYSSGHPGADEGLSILKALSDLFRRHSILAPMALLSPLAARDVNLRKPFLLLGSAAALFLAMVGIADIYFARNLMPFLPEFDCLIAVGAWGAVGIIPFNAASKLRFLRPKVLLMLLILAVACGNSLDSARQTWLRARETDTRTLAYDWITENLAPGVRILQEAYSPQLYFSDRFKITYLWTISQIQFDEAVERFDYVVVSENQWRRFREWGHKTYDPLFEREPLRAWVEQPGRSYGPEIRIYSVRNDPKSQS